MRSSRHDIAQQTYLNNLLVRAACNEQRLLVGIGVEFDAVRRFAICESPDTRAGLGVPVLDPSIVTCAQELVTVVGVANVTDSFGVASKSAQHFTVVVHVPKLHTHSTAQHSL
jgi:hypothetical protein